MQKKLNSLVGVECTSCKDKIHSKGESHVTWCDCRKVGITGNQGYPKVMGTGEFKFIKIKQ